LTLTTNATGTVDATQGVPFTLVFDGSNGVEHLKIVSDWADNAQFTFSIMDVADDGSGDADAVEGEMSVSVTVTPLTAGDYTIRVYVAAGGALSARADVTVSVQENTDTTFTTPTTPTTSTDTTDPEEARIELWTFLMYTLNPIVAVMLVIFGIVMLKRTQR